MTKTSSLFIYLYFITYHASSSSSSSLREYESTEDVGRYLYNYGYLSLERVKHTKAEIAKGLHRLQEKFGLKQTGKVDEETLVLINTPRCHEGDEQMQRKFRPTSRKFSVAVHGVGNLIDAFPNRSDPIFRRAFNLWSDASRIVFYDARRNSTPDINIVLQSDEFHHHMVPSDVLLATSPPDSLKVILNREAAFILPSAQNGNVPRKGSDMLRALAHGIGHNLGFPHSYQNDSIMNPLFPIVDSPRAPSLNAKDRDLLQHLYRPPQENVREQMQDEEQDIRPSLRSCGNAVTLSVLSMIFIHLAFTFN